MTNAAKRQTTGAVFSVRADISKTGTLGIGVKDLADNVLAVSMLKRVGGLPGAGEQAGIRLGDIVFGINFIPTREGSKTLLQVLKKEVEKGRKVLHVQCWRCHQLCSDPVPGSLFPRADDVIVQAHSLYRTKVFSDWERWNFIEILLGHMVEDLNLRGKSSKGVTEGGGSSFSPTVPNRDSVPSPRHATQSLNISSDREIRSKQMGILDLERNILQAKGLRNALCVRIVHTKLQGDTTVYVLRVEDIETGLQWVVHRRYRDFYALNEELAEMSHFTKDLNFPKKRISIRGSSKLVESRIVQLEQYTRRVLHLLTLYATMDPLASKSLRHLQNFLGVDKYIDCIHPPPVDDQRYVELMAYRFLNDFSSPACQQCVRFVTTVDLDSMITQGPQGYKPALNHLSAALNEVELFVMQQHQQQMVHALKHRKPDWTQEQLRTFVRRCVRRQVEAALFLPLRRNAFRIVYSFIAKQSQKMQRALGILQQAPPEYFMVDPNVLQAKILPKAVKAFRDIIHAYLPSDQGQLLMQAATTVMELHTECQRIAESTSALTQGNKQTNGVGHEGVAGDLTGIKRPSLIFQQSEQQKVEGGNTQLKQGGETASQTTSPAADSPTQRRMSWFHERMSSNVNPRESEKVATFDVIKEQNSEFKYATEQSEKAQDEGKEEETGQAQAQIFTGANESVEQISSSPPSSSSLSSKSSSRLVEIFRKSIGRKSSVSDDQSQSSSSKSDKVTGAKKDVYDRVSSPSQPSTSPAISIPQPTSLSYVQTPSSITSPSSNSSTINSSSVTPKFSKPNLMDKATLEDPVREMFYSHETSLPDKVFDGLLPSDVYSRLSFYSDRQSFDRQSIDLITLHESSGAVQGRDGNFPPFPPSPNPSQILNTNNVTTSAMTPNQPLNDTQSPIPTPTLTPTPSSLPVPLERSTERKGNTVRFSEANQCHVDSGNGNNNSNINTNININCTDNHANVEITTPTRTDNNNMQTPSSISSILSPTPSLASQDASSPLRHAYTNTTDPDMSLIEGADAEGQIKSKGFNENADASRQTKQNVVSADDFLPMFTYMLVQADLPQLLLVKEMMTNLIDDEETYGECGYYLATLEAATQHICDLAEDFQKEVGEKKQAFDVSNNQ